MIAIFSKTERQVKAELQLVPKNMFKIIRIPDDIRGIIFTGIILMYGCYDDVQKRDALDALEERQPELFKELNE